MFTSAIVPCLYSVDIDNTSQNMFVESRVGASKVTERSDNQLGSLYREFRFAFSRTEDIRISMRGGVRESSVLTISKLQIVRVVTLDFKGDTETRLQDVVRRRVDHALLDRGAARRPTSQDSVSLL